jgi:hypothetical protein
MSAKNRADVIVHPLTYYQKAAIGPRVHNATPMQLVYPNGSFGIGIAVTDAHVHGPAPPYDLSNVVIASLPEISAMDATQIRGLKWAFLSLGVCNLIITSIMFFEAATVDVSNVVKSTKSLSNIYDTVSPHRSENELVYYSFSIIIIAVGMMSSILENALGLSFFALTTLLMFFLGTATLPYFIYSIRFIFDLFMLYIGLVLRSRITVTFLSANALPSF